MELRFQWDRLQSPIVFNINTHEEPINMANRIVYKDGKEFACKHMRQVNEMLEDGWSMTPQPQKSAKPKKAKVKVEADEVKVDSPFNDGEPLNIDLGTIENNSKENE